MAQVQNKRGQNKQFSDEKILEELKKLDNPGCRHILFSSSNAKLFFIEPEGKVRDVSEPLNLSIIRIQDDATNTIFFKGGHWVYPLNLAFPCNSSIEGLFLFPDIYSEAKEGSVALSLPKEEWRTLENILTGILGKEKTNGFRENTTLHSIANTFKFIGEGGKYLRLDLANDLEMWTVLINTASNCLFGKKIVNESTVHKATKAFKWASAATTISSVIGNTLDMIANALEENDMQRYRCEEVEKSTKRIIRWTQQKKTLCPPQTLTARPDKYKPGWQHQLKH